MFTVHVEAPQPASPVLAAELRAIYGGDLVLPTRADRPAVLTNFVTSHDGRISFSDPGHAGGGDVGGFDEHDSWLMAILRSVANAVMVGAGTLRMEPEHRWTAQFLRPDHAHLFPAKPIQVIVSMDGDVPGDAAIFADPTLKVVVATTQLGWATAQSICGPCGHVEVVRFGNDEVDLNALLRWLRDTHDVDVVLCEGGASLYGSLLKQGCCDEQFLTLSPKLIGDDTSSAEPKRPSLIEGVRFTPDHHPRTELMSVRQHGSYLYLRHRVTNAC